MSEFPSEYPVRLRKISWCIEGKDGNMICGPHKYFNRHLNYASKGDSCFIKQVVLDWAYAKAGMGKELFDEIAQYFVTCWGFYYVEGDEEFRISEKKDKNTNKPIFNHETWRKMWGVNASLEETDAMLDKIITYVKKFYDRILQNHFDEMSKKKFE